MPLTGPKDVASAGGSGAQGACNIPAASSGRLLPSENDERLQPSAPYCPQTSAQGGHASASGGAQLSPAERIQDLVDQGIPRDEAAARVLITEANLTSATDRYDKHYFRLKPEWGVHFICLLYLYEEKSSNFSNI